MWEDEKGKVPTALPHKRLAKNTKDRSEPQATH